MALPVSSKHSDKMPEARTQPSAICALGHLLPASTPSLPSPDPGPWHSQGRPQGAGPAPGQSPLRLSCKGNAPPSTGRGERAREALQPTAVSPQGSARFQKVPQGGQPHGCQRGTLTCCPGSPAGLPLGYQSLVWEAGYGASFTGSGTGRAPRRVGRLALLQGALVLPQPPQPQGMQVRSHRICSTAQTAG